MYIYIYVCFGQNTASSTALEKSLDWDSMVQQYDGRCCPLVNNSAVFDFCGHLVNEFGVLC